MEIKILKKLFDEGLLMSARIVPAPMEEGRYFLIFEKPNGGIEQVTRARDNVNKSYRRINGALLDAQEIGFNEVTVQFN